MWQYQMREISCKKGRKGVKYKRLCVEIQRMWNMKCMIIPVITGDTGIVTKGLKKNLETVPRKQSIYSLKRRLYFEHHTSYGRYCSLQLEA
jgi:hypothetical protein